MRTTISRRISSAGLRASGSLVSKFASMASAAGMSAGTAAALVVAAGLVGYGIGTAINAAWDRIARNRDPVYRKEQIALQYAKARRELATRQGHALNPTEQKVLAEWFKQRLRDAGQSTTLPGR